MDTNISFREGKCCALIWNICWIWQDSSLNAVLRVSRCLRPSVKKKNSSHFLKNFCRSITWTANWMRAWRFCSTALTGWSHRKVMRENGGIMRWSLTVGEERQISHPEDSALIITVFPILSVLRRVMKTEIPISEEITLPTAFCSYWKSALHKCWDVCLMIYFPVQRNRLSGKWMRHTGRRKPISRHSLKAMRRRAGNSTFLWKTITTTCLNWQSR